MKHALLVITTILVLGPQLPAQTPATDPAHLRQMEQDHAESQYQKAIESLSVEEHDLRALTHRLDVSPDALRKTAARLDEQLETLHLEQAAADARRRAIENALKQEGDRAEARLQADAVIIELQKVVTAREMQLKRVHALVAAAAEPQADVDATAAMLAEAKARLAERQQNVFNGIDAENMTSFRRELLNLTINEEERHAKTEYLTKQYDLLSKALTSVNRIEQSRDAVRSARAMIDRVAERWETVRFDPNPQPKGQTESPATRESPARP